MGKRLFVGNLPYRVSADQLNEIFSSNGTVVDVFIPLDRETRRPRGFALVEMSTDEEAAAAIEAHIKSLDAIHLATCALLGANIGIVTHDAQMSAAAASLGLETMDPLA